MKKGILFAVSLCFTVLLSSQVIAAVPYGVIKKASVAPVVDGVIDAVWADANAYNINLQMGTPTLGTPGSTTWKALWRNEGIYILVQVNDNVFFPAYAGAVPNEPWMYDKIEIYLDVNTVLADGLGPKNNSGHYIISPGFVQEQINGTPVTAGDGVVNAFRVTNPAYVAEYFIPFTKLLDKDGVEVPKNATIGFDVTVLDRDSEATDRPSANWSSNNAFGGSYDNMDGCGTIILEGISVSEITVSTAGGVITIETDNGTLQMIAGILPVDATHQNLTWSVENGTGKAKISSTGLLTALMNGVVNVKAKAKDGSGVFGMATVTISGQVVQMSEINLIKNGHFNDVTSGFPDLWSFGSSSGDPKPTVEDGVVVCYPKATPPNFWEYQLMQFNLEAIPNIPYTFSFTARADTDRSIVVRFTDTANGYKEYGISTDPEAIDGKSSWLVNLTTAPTTYTFHVVFNQIVENTIQLFAFQLNATSDKVYIDDVSLASDEELTGFKLSATTASIAASAGSKATVVLTTGAGWTANSNQTWLSVSPGSGTGNQTLTFTAEANASNGTRKAMVTVSASGFPEPQTITITQDGSILNATAGNLKTLLSADELANTSKLTLAGTIDARDFKTMRDNMPMLAEIDLSGVTVAAYSGTEGTSMWGNNNYAANAIPEFAFSTDDWTGQTRIKTIIIPGSITSIGQLAFADCRGLTAMIIPPLVTTIGQEAFRNGKSFTSIVIPPSVTNLDGAFQRFAGLINVDPNNPNYSSMDGILFNKTKTSLILYPSSKTGGYTIPSSVVSIQRIAFEECTQLTSLQIPSSVKTIYGYAISVCTSLTSLSIPSSVTTLQNNAFAWCNGLTSITVGWPTPLDLSSSPDVFLGVNKSTCTLCVPNGTATLYRAANQWKDFTNIVEMAEFKLSATSATIVATGGTATVDLTTGLSWTASSDQTWLTVNSLSGTGNQTFTFAATANSSLSSRIATVTVSATGLPSQTIIIAQAGATKTLNVTAGGLSSALTATELSTATNLVLSGTIDARDFKTMRDNMPMLAEVDLSGVSVVAYTGTGGTAASGSITYPADGIPEKAFSLGDWTGQTRITSIIIPGTIKSIGALAFADCKGLKAFIIPPSVTTIVYGAFQNCTSFTSIIIPPSVTNLNGAFHRFAGLIEVDADNPNYSDIDGILFNKTQTSFVLYPTSKTGGYTIPSSVVEIQGIAFAGCSQLTSIQIPSSVQSIYGYAFSACSSLTSLNIPSSVTNLKENAFEWCGALNSISVGWLTPLDLNSSLLVFRGVNTSTCILHVPYGTASLYSAANQWKDFTNIVEMAEFKLSATAATIAAAGGTAEVNLTTGLSWTASSDQTWLAVSSASGTGNQTFTFTATANSSLSARIATVSVTATGIASQTIIITQPGAPKTLAVTAGGLATALTATELSTITKLTLTGTIDARDFKTMRDNMPMLAIVDLSGVTIVAYNGPDGTSLWGNNNYLVNTIPEAAFFNNNGQNNSTLTSVILPSSTTSIGNNSFQNCSGLTAFTIPSTVTSIYWDAFSNCTGLTTITIPPSVTLIRERAFGWAPTLLNVDPANPNYSSIDGVLFNKVKTTLIQYPTSKTGAYTIPSSVTSIGVNAFSGCSQLTSVNIPASVQTIDNSAFDQCQGLTAVSIPSSVTTIKSNAFSNCSRLSSINVNSPAPINLGANPNVFMNVNKTICSLNVPFGAKAAYLSANQWQDFTNIVEMAEFKLSATKATIAATGGTATVDLTTSLSWTASSDQTWLVVSPVSGAGNQTFTFTATANSSLSSRIATVTVSATGLPPQTIIITQAGATKTLPVTAGGLSSALTASELSTATNLELTGTIDARDFKTMRDMMPMLAQIDLSGASIVAYNGPDGPSMWGNNNYAANAIPEFAFSMGDWTGQTRITSIVIPGSITSIGQLAFADCRGLTAMIIPPLVTTIGSEAFRNGMSFTSIIIPPSVTNLDGAFQRFAGLIHVDPNNTNYSSMDGILFNKTKTSLILYPTSKTGGYTIPSSVVEIRGTAFDDCSQLTSIQIPSSVQSIYGHAFNGCWGLSSLFIPSSVTTIQDNAFSWCNGLTSITVGWPTPLDLSSSPDVFREVNKSTCTLYVPYGTKALYAAANQWKDFTNIVEMAEFKLSATAATIAAAGGTAEVNLTTGLSWTASSDQTWLAVSSASGTGNQTFTFTATANSSLSARIATVSVTATGIASQTIIITQPGAPKTLAVTAGGLATALTANELSTITKLTLTGIIDARDFKTMRDNMPMLAEVDLSGVSVVAYTGTGGTAGSGSIAYPATAIPQKAFSIDDWTGQTRITSIVIPGSITSIGTLAFADCRGLTAMIIPPLVTTIGQNAFRNGNSFTSIVIPPSVTSCNNAFKRFAGLIQVDANNPNYSSMDGVLFNKNKTNLILCPNSKTGTYIIPSSVISIQMIAFDECSKLTSIQIPSSVQTIYDYAINDCFGLTSVTIPSSITFIGSYAFQNCNSLTSIYANRSNPVNLSSVSGVFNLINKTTCKLYVPFGSSALYAAANQWKDFANIVEMAEFKLSATSVTIPVTGGTATVNLTTGLAWTAGSDQTWLTVNSLSGAGNKSFTFTATANSSLSSRIATVTVSSTGLPSQTIVITQIGTPKTATVTAGGLAMALTATELNTISVLNLTGIIDARDFKTMRDKMPMLALIDISGVTISAYTGTEGTASTSNTAYPANTVPDYAFYASSTGYGKTSLTSIVLPSSVTAIGNYAFCICSGLTSVILPSSVTSIGNSAFYYCSGLTSVNIPSLVTSIGTQAFYRCTAPIAVDAANPNYSALDGVLFNKLQTVLIQCPVSKTGSYTIPSTVNSLVGYAFAYCTNITAVNIPTSVTNIGTNAFNSCSGLLSMNIPASVTAIGTNAFSFCTSLTSVSIPSSVTSVYSNIFSFCSGLTTVTIPSTVTIIQMQAFYNCSSLSKIVALETTPVNLANSNNVFYNVNKTTCTLNVPYGTKALYAAANQWKDFTNIVELDFSLSATKFNPGAEGGTVNIDIASAVAWTVNSDHSWLTVSPAAGTGNSTLVLTAAANPTTTIRTATVSVLTAASIPQTITVIQAALPKTLNITAGGLSAALSQEEKNSLTTLTLTGTMDARDFRILRDAMPLLEVLDISGVTISAYSGNDGTAEAVNYNYPADGIPDFAFCVPSIFIGKTKLSSIITPPSITSIGQRAFSFCSSLSTLNITSSIVSIGAQAFCSSKTAVTVDAGNPNYSALDGVLFNKDNTRLIHCPTAKTGSYTIPATVNLIESRAFNYCSNLTSIVIPSSITSIGDYEFYNCTSLLSVDIPVSVTSIGKYAFNYCLRLATVTIPAGVTVINEGTFQYCSNLTSIIIPSSVTSVTDYAFYGCYSLISIDIPASVTSIGKYAFYNCSKLTSVTIPNGVATINDWTFSFCSSLTSVTIPSSVTSIGGYAFYYCTALSSIKAYNNTPVNLVPSPNVFYNVNKTTCTLYVPFGTSGLYRAANQWQDFVNIVEMPDFKLSAATANIAANAGSTATVDLTSNTTWTASSDQTWLAVSPTSGTGNKTLTFTAEANSAATTRTATVTISATGVASLTVTVTQAAKIISHFIPVWTGNGFDHMNINIYSAKLDGVDLEADDEVGIFDGTICVGVGTLTGPITSLNTLDIAVSKNDGTGNGYIPGNAITFKLYDKSKDLEMNNVTAIYSNTDPSWSTDGKFTIGATAFAELSGLTKVTQDITLNTGWNIISANVIPANLNLKDIFQSLIDAGKLKKVMDEAGKTIENFGAFGGWKNNIGNLNSAKGYKVNVLSNSTLSLEGTPVSLPFDLALAAGWNIISYPSATALDAKALVQSLIDAGKLKKVMDEAGKTIENFGAFGGWKNNIGNFLPGKGYKVNVLENCTLTIPANGTKAATIVPEVLASTHFTKAFKGNGTDHTTINLVNLQASGLQAGDEIGIYDGKLCVGSQTIGSEDVLSGIFSIPASANDGIGESPNGFISGNKVSVKLYRDGQAYPLTLAKLEGQDIFDKNASLFAQVSMVGATGLNGFDNEISFRCYPNPFSGQVTIEIQSTSTDKLEVNIYDLNGKLLRKLYSGKAQNQGTIVWDGRNNGGSRVVQGTYLINANGRIEKVVLKD